METIVNSIIAGLSAGIISFLLAVIFVKKGPKGDRGPDGYPGPTGMMGERGRKGDPGKFTRDDLRNMVNDVFKQKFQ